MSGHGKGLEVDTVNIGHGKGLDTVNMSGHGKGLDV